MKITLLTVGKTENNYLNEGISLYIERLSHYIKFEVVEVQIPKNVRKLNSDQLKDFEGKAIIKYFQGVDLIILLDEKGQNYNSEQFAEWIQKNMNAGIRHLMFVVGGPFGFSKDIYNAAHGKISLSAMTFSHQMVRLFFTEQLYRAFTILRNEPYHNA